MNVPAQITPISASPRSRRLPSTSFTMGSCPSATPPAKTNQSTPIAGSLTCAAVLRERRQELAHHGDPRADEDDIENDVAEKDTVPQHVCVPAGFVMRLDMTRRGNEPQHLEAHGGRRSWFG